MGSSGRGRAETPACNPSPATGAHGPIHICIYIYAYMHIHIELQPASGGGLMTRAARKRVCVALLAVAVALYYHVRDRPAPHCHSWSPETATTPMQSREWYSPARAAMTYSHPYITTRVVLDMVIEHDIWYTAVLYICDFEFFGYHVSLLLGLPYRQTPRRHEDVGGPCTLHDAPWCRRGVYTPRPTALHIYGYMCGPFKLFFYTVLYPRGTHMSNAVS